MLLLYTSTTSGSSTVSDNLESVESVELVSYVQFIVHIIILSAERYSCNSVLKLLYFVNLHTYCRCE